MLSTFSLRRVVRVKRCQEDTVRATLRLIGLLELVRTGQTMDHILYFLSRVVTTLFFIGLLGCIPVVTLSWISILKNEFFPGDDDADELHNSAQESVTRVLP